MLRVFLKKLLRQNHRHVYSRTALYDGVFSFVPKGEYSTKKEKDHGQMKIRLAILDHDTNYLDAICSSFETKYPDKLELYSFTDLPIALSALKETKIDVFLADSSFDINVGTLPPKCSFSYLSDMQGVASVKGQRSVCKFQKADLIYKYVLSIFSENTENILGISPDNGAAKVIFFTSVSGGAGASTMAAAAAMHFAAKGKKVLYLNLEKFGSADIFFEGSGQFDMSDVIFALKSKKGTLGLKLESCVRCDESGVFFYASPKIALDMLELDSEDIVALLDELRASGGYDYIIADTDWAIDKNSCAVFKTAHSIVWTCDGSIISNTKLTRAYSALAAMEQASDTSLCSCVCVIYNKFSSKTGKILDSGIGIRSLGGAPRKEGIDAVQTARQLSEMQIFDKI